MKRALPVLFLAALAAGAADKSQPVTVRGENDEIAITATLINDREAIKKEVGSDLDGYFILVRAEVMPKKGKLAVSRDDFILHTDKDGQKSQPFAPSQIAGKATLVISETGGSGGMATDRPGPVIGGWPGGGRPTRLPGNQGVMGNSGDPASATATANTSGKDKGDSPLLASLKQKVFPDKQTSEPVSGLLYFQLEGKHKAKDLDLRYNGPAGRLTLLFRTK